MIHQFDSLIEECNHAEVEDVFPEGVLEDIQNGEMIFELPEKGVIIDALEAESYEFRGKENQISYQLKWDGQKFVKF